MENSMSKPENLPLELNSIRDAAIDFALGRTEKEPEKLADLYQWYLTDGYGDEVNIIDNVVNFSDLIENYFSDETLVFEEGVEASDINDEVRLDYAKQRIEGLLDSSLFVMIKNIENSKGEKAIIGYLEEQGLQEVDSGTHWYGIYSSENAFIQDLENSDWLKFLCDVESFTDEEILKYWNR